MALEACVLTRKSLSLVLCGMTLCLSIDQFLQLRQLFYKISHFIQSPQAAQLRRASAKFRERSTYPISVRVWVPPHTSTLLRNISSSLRVLYCPEFPL